MERTVGPYRVLRRIGERGGMATVYLAEQTTLGRVVALKELDLRAPDPRVVERFIDEARIASSLRHPNIVAVHDFFELDGVPYISMEFVERGSLRRYVGGLTLPQTFGVLEGVLAGLAHAHAAEVIHRDLKPENLLVSADGAVKIADFGIARALRRATRYTGTGITVGTPAYMAPEQAMALQVTPATDLHSVGVIAFELLSGALPMTADAPMALMLRKVHESSPSLRLVVDVDPRLAGLVDRLLARVPDDRPQSAREVWEELEEIAVALLGPFWRRDARLPEPGGVSDPDHPLEPAPFEVTSEEPGYVTYKPPPPLLPADVARSVKKAEAEAAEPPAARDASAVAGAGERAVVDPWARPAVDPALRPTQPPTSAPTVIEKVRPVFPEPVPEPRSWRVWYVVAGVVVAAAVAAGAVLAVASRRDSPRPAASVTPAPTPSPTPTPTPTPTSTPSPSPTPTPTTNDPQEAQLLTYVNDRIGPSASCELDPELPDGATARARCELPGGFPAVYTQFATMKAMKAYFATLSEEGEPQDLGRCAAEGEWFTDDGKVAGQLIGRRVGARSVLAWSDERELVAAYASASRGDRADLCSSWESYG